MEWFFDRERKVSKLLVAVDSGSGWYEYPGTCGSNIGK